MARVVATMGARKVDGTWGVELSRVPSGSAQLGATPLAVVGLETTGLNYWGNDRIIELAVLGYDWEKGEVNEKLVSLVNPGRDLGRTDIHGITGEEVKHAPAFEELAGDLSAILGGAILVGHNVGFIVGFLRSEFGRMGIEFPHFPTVCTLSLLSQLPDPPGRTLAACCSRLGIEEDALQTAEGDARATFHLLGLCVKELEPRSLADLGCDRAALVHDGWTPPSPLARKVTRSKAAQLCAQERSYLSRLVSTLPGSKGGTIREAQYLNLLDRALEDRSLSAEEAECLAQEAGRLGMGPAEVHAAHEAYVWTLAREAKADGVVTPLERRDLDQVSELLGVQPESLDEILSNLPSVASPARPLPDCPLAGRSVCFTGELLGKRDGVRLTREDAEQVARLRGLMVVAGVSKALDILVVADPETQSGKAKKARLYGTRIMAEAAFWKAVGMQAE